MTLRSVGRTGFLVALLVGLVGIPTEPADAVSEYRMRLWMQPPAATTGNNACLSQLWHPSTVPGEDPIHSLDWQRKCAVGESEAVRFRARAAAPDDPCCDEVVWATGEPDQLDDLMCGGAPLRHARVRIRSEWDNTVKGRYMLQHVDVSAASDFDIYFREGGSFHDAAYNDVAIGETTDDGPPRAGCWTAFHIHENNAGSRWDDWSTGYYNNSNDLCDCHRVEHKSTWTRRLRWDDVI